MTLKVLGVLLALFKAVPALKDWWEQLIVLYVEHQKKVIRREIREAITYALVEQDQRKIEKALGSPHAGKPVNVPNSEIVDSLPGVKRVRNKKAN
jgi:hypothetical protein